MVRGVIRIGKYCFGLSHSAIYKKFCFNFVHPKEAIVSVQLAIGKVLFSVVQDFTWSVNFDCRKQYLPVSLKQEIRLLIPDSKTWGIRTRRRRKVLFLVKANLRKLNGNSQQTARKCHTQTKSQSRGSLILSD